MRRRAQDILNKTMRRIENRWETGLLWRDEDKIHTEQNARNRYEVFVAQRLGEIQNLTDVNQWRYISSTENVADEATKRHQTIDISSNSRWLHGPCFLKLPQENWPMEKMNDFPESIDKKLLEERKEYVFMSYSNTDIPVPSMQYFSKGTKLKRSTGWMLRFIKKGKRGLPLTPVDMISNM
ncbi:hypothetical protein JTB14_000693 [Gonioctena quinquepunctata]|nr:hypothetical protein JTB14_000693 [Gonioctena quinquepunctata]